LGPDAKDVEDSGAPAPLVTVVLIAYNHERYVCEALAGVLAQTYEPLEIILSDDGSTDRTFELMRDAARDYRGPHKIILNRNTKNLNVGDHLNKAASLASGDLIVLAAADDASAPTRAEAIARLWIAEGKPSALLHSSFEPIDAQSQPVSVDDEEVSHGDENLLRMAHGDIRILGATTAMTRDIFTRFPKLDSSVRHEDRVFPWRALLLGGRVLFLDEKLVRYRVDGGVSRMKIETARDYLFSYVPSYWARTLPDAIQRLADLESLPDYDRNLAKECVATIADHRAFVALAQSSGVALETAALDGLRNGARLAPLAKLYLKRRFLWGFEAFFWLQRKLSVRRPTPAPQ